MRAPLLPAVIAFALWATACAGTTTPRVAPGPPPAWPRPPAAARLIFERSLPDPDRPDQRSGFRRVVDAILGLEPGAGEPVLVRPFGVAALPGAVYVADPDAPGVLRADLASGAFEPVRCRDGEWGAPMAVTIGPGGVVYVADAGLAVVVRIAPDGRCDRWGSGTLERPTALALLGERLYVADPPRHQVVAYDASGAEVLRFGARGDGDAGFNFPTGLAAAPDGTLLVIDALNYKVKRFGPDGTLLSSFGEAGDDGGRFSRPKAVAVDAAGRIYVTDTQRGLVLAFEADGRFIYAAGGIGDGPGQLSMPAGVAIAGDLLVVADGQHRRVETYRFTGDRP